MIGDTLLWSAATIFLFMNLFYAIAVWQKNAGLIDIGWGLGFIAVVWTMILTTADLTSVQLAVSGLVTIWGLRLSWHVAARNLDQPEDWRYAQWRKDWGKNYWWRSYLQIFMLQGLLMLIISAPAIVAFATDAEISASWLYAGAIVWLVGFIFELVGDRQLSRFIADKRAKRTKEKLLTTGLWAYTRHPNYFGEVVQWWGLWLIVLSLDYGPLAVVSPLMITYLILFVSGVPMLERKYADNRAWQDYAERTSKFIPMWPKK